MFGRDPEDEDRLPKRPDVRRSIWSLIDMPCLNEIAFDTSTSSVAIDQVFALVKDHAGRDQTSASCIHCGYGDNAIMLVSLKLSSGAGFSSKSGGGLFALVRFWTGCLSYDLNDQDSTLWYGDSPEDLVMICADDASREMLLQRGLDLDRTTLIRQILDENLLALGVVDIALDYCCLLHRQARPNKTK